MKLQKYFFLLIIFFLQSTAIAQESKIKNAEKIMKPHIEKVIKEFKDNEQYGKSVAERAVQDAKGGPMGGAKAHPWKNGNPASFAHYFIDSFFALDSRREFNTQNYMQAWSCFSPKLLVKADGGDKETPKEGGTKLFDYIGPSGDNISLAMACRGKCPHTFSGVPENFIPDILDPIFYPFPIPAHNNPFNHEPGSGPSRYHALCPHDTYVHGPAVADYGYRYNGFEVVEYWFPEYEVNINNYGINRIDPILTPLKSKHGGQYTRQGLISQKKQQEQMMRQHLQQDYPLDMSNYKENPNRQDPFIGQGVWGGYAFPDFEDKGYAHIYRTWLSVTMGDKKKQTIKGWLYDSEFSLYDALPEKSTEHDPAVVWTEFGMFDVITSIPSMSQDYRGDIMNALYQNSHKNYVEAAKQQNPFWKSQGAMAYRAGKWSQTYGDLAKALEISPNQNGILKEAVYRGGHELFPLVTNISGFGTPTISSAAIMARRALFLAGDPKSVAHYPSKSEKDRMYQYTINKLNPELELDKMSLSYPYGPKEKLSQGPGPTQISECFRSQNIPNIVNNNAQLDQWIEKNLGRKLVGYYSDRALTEQGGDISFVYWNKRIGCFCDRCGLPTGSQNLLDPATGEKGNGDNYKAIKRTPYCRYPNVPKMKAWNAWAQENTFEDCDKNHNPDDTRPDATIIFDGRGLRDEETVNLP